MNRTRQNYIILIVLAVLITGGLAVSGVLVRDDSQLTDNTRPFADFATHRCSLKKWVTFLAMSEQRQVDFAVAQKQFAFDFLRSTKNGFYTMLLLDNGDYAYLQFNTSGLLQHAAVFPVGWDDAFFDDLANRTPSVEEQEKLQNYGLTVNQARAFPTSSGYRLVSFADSAITLDTLSYTQCADSGLLPLLEIDVVGLNQKNP